jgi:hypothetical protein
MPQEVKRLFSELRRHHHRSASENVATLLDDDSHGHLRSISFVHIKRLWSSFMEEELQCMLLGVGRRSEGFF